MRHLLSTNIIPSMGGVASQRRQERIAVADGRTLLVAGMSLQVCVLIVVRVYNFGRIYDIDFCL